MQIMLRSPKDTLAAALATTGVLAIIVNAVFLQAGRHPSPLFGTMVQPFTSTALAPPQRSEVVPIAPVRQAAPSLPAGSPIPRPRPPEAEQRRADPLGNLVRSTSMTQGAPRPSAAVPADDSEKSEPTSLSSQRIAAVQRALTDYGYGQLKATGTVGADTQAAIQKFERERKLPVTGQVSERLVRELSLATGRSFEER